MNLTPEMYEEFIRPYDAQLLRHFGGGTVHFCGRGEHFIDAMSRIPDLHGINMSQPHLNDMGKILSCTVDRGIPFALPQRAIMISAGTTLACSTNFSACLQQTPELLPWQSNSGAFLLFFYECASSTPSLRSSLRLIT